MKGLTITMFNTKSTDTVLDYREILVTPDRARQWLGGNLSNRNKKPAKIAGMAANMQDGMWYLNGEALKFTGTVSEPEKLLDGQNRLMAVIESGVPVTLGVFFGVAEESQEAMDSGTRRSVSDNLTIAGKSHPTIVAAAATIALRVRDGNVNGGQLRSTNVEIQQFIRDNHDLAVAADVASRYAKRAGVAPSFVAYTFWVMAEIDANDAVDFWSAASDKVGLRAGDPVIAMTEKFMSYKTANKKLPLGIALSMIFRAWNARRRGKQMKSMYTHMNGEVVAIPKPI